MSRYESPSRKYLRTANKMASGGNRKPAEDADPCWIGGQERRRFISAASPCRPCRRYATEPVQLPIPTWAFAVDLAELRPPRP